MHEYRRIGISYSDEGAAAAWKIIPLAVGRKGTEYIIHTVLPNTALTSIQQI